MEAFSFTKSDAVWTSLEQFQGKLAPGDSSAPRVLLQVRELQPSGLRPGGTDAPALHVAELDQVNLSHGK